VRRDVPIEVVDQRGVERLLFFDGGADQPPDEATKPPFERPVARGGPSGRMFQARLMG
jgi:hypothetical protein